MATLVSRRPGVKPGRLVRFPDAMMVLYPRDEGPVASLLVRLAALSASFRAVGTPAALRIAGEQAEQVTALRAEKGGAA